MTALAIRSSVRSSSIGPGLLARNRSVLLEQRRFRLDQLAELDRRGALSSSDPAIREVAAVLASGARTALIDICAALRQMAAGRYGWCRDCGKRLTPERLEALPHVTRCVQCHRADVLTPR